jgi:hypothetical protein
LTTLVTALLTSAITLTDWQQQQARSTAETTAEPTEQVRRAGQGCRTQQSHQQQERPRRPSVPRDELLPAAIAGPSRASATGADQVYPASFGLPPASLLCRIKRDEQPRTADWSCRLDCAAVTARREIQRQVAAS